MIATINSRAAPMGRDHRVLPPNAPLSERGVYAASPSKRPPANSFTQPARTLKRSEGRAPVAVPGRASRDGTHPVTATTFLFLLLLATILPTQADSLATNQTRFAQQAESAFKKARTRLESEPNSAEAAWQFGRACYDWADCATSNSQRATIAQLGIAACQGLIAANTNSAPGHYYLALNFSQLARTKTLGALKIVEQMEQEFSTALRVDPKYDFAGADRGLALLYSAAPGWPVSVGSRSQAKAHLQNALKLNPEYPENLLNLAEVELGWGDHAGAGRELKALDELWPAAQKQFTGEPWASSWADWDKRRAELRKKAAETPPVLESPKRPR